MNSAFPERLLVIDVETTGLDPARDSIVQLASCVLGRNDLKEEKYFSSRVKPESQMQEYAKAIHGMSYEELATAPTIDSVIAQFEKYAPSDAVISGHNVAFDVAFLKAAYSRTGFRYPFDYHTLDLWSVAFFVLSAQRIALPEYNLTSLCKLYGIKRNAKHDALEDVRATAQVLRHLFDTIKIEPLDVLAPYDFPRRA